MADFEDTATGLNHPVTGITAIPISATWHHAAVTYDTATDTWNLYLDGDLERTLAAGGNFTPRSDSASSTPPSARRSTPPASLAGFFNGVLDEVRIWNVARSQAQIQASKDQELTSGTGLIARYGLNEGTGTAVANSIAGGVNGTAVNGPLWVAGAPFAPAATRRRSSAPTSPDRSDTEGAVISLDADATDPNLGDTLTYRATGLPNGISINARHGVISGTLSATCSGHPLPSSSPSATAR